MAADHGPFTEFGATHGLPHRASEPGAVSLEEVPVAPMTWKQAGFISADGSISMTELVQGTTSRVRSCRRAARRRPLRSRRAIC